MKYEDRDETPTYEITHSGSSTSPEGLDLGEAGRRECIQIAFRCEMECDLTNYRLMIKQHKGTTYMQWIRKSK